VKHPFLALAGEYSTLLARMQITRQSEVDSVAHRLLQFKSRYAIVYSTTGVPIVVLAALNERESGSRFNTYLGNGDSILHPTAHVPKGRGPFQTWEAGAKDALHLDGLDQIRNVPGGWVWARACYETNLFNGFGKLGTRTSYLWAGTNIYERGKYTSDHHFDPDVVDKQLGVIPIMVRMIELDPSLSLIDPLPAVHPDLDQALPPAPPIPLGHGGEDSAHDTKWIQASLNELDPKNHFTVDGIWGRQTRRAVIAFQQSYALEPDGIVGPKTIAAIEEALRAEVS
jgi:lysozyme family protein